MSAMHLSVRCHAVITPDGIYKNAVISYEGTHVPSYDKPLLIKVSDISVRPFTGEIHSTVDFNGIAVAGTIELPTEKLSVESLSAVVAKISANVRYPIDYLCFMPLMI